MNRQKTQVVSGISAAHQGLAIACLAMGLCACSLGAAAEESTMLTVDYDSLISRADITQNVTVHSDSSVRVHRTQSVDAKRSWSVGALQQRRRRNTVPVGEERFL